MTTVLLFFNTETNYNKKVSSTKQNIFFHSNQRTTFTFVHVAVGYDAGQFGRVNRKRPAPALPPLVNVLLHHRRHVAHVIIAPPLRLVALSAASCGGSREHVVAVVVVAFLIVTVLVVAFLIVAVLVVAFLVVAVVIVAVLIVAVSVVLLTF